MLGEVGLGPDVTNGGGRRPGVLWVDDVTGKLRFQCNELMREAQREEKSVSNTFIDVEN